MGIWFVYLYNYYAYLLRALGNSLTPLIYLAISVVLNIVLDIWFIVKLHYGIEGAAAATIISQAVSAIGLCFYCWKKVPETRLSRKDFKVSRQLLKQVFSYASLTCIQQSVMNFGILMVQGLVNSFGTAVMAAFTAAVKIDSFAYMPVQDFGNAFSTFTAQNYGAGKNARILKGIKSAFGITTLFCLLLSLAIFLFTPQLMQIFISPEETEIIRIGTEYLRIEGSFYLGIGYLFFMVRILQSRLQTGNVHHFNDSLFRNPSGVGLCTGCHPFHRCTQHLVVNPYRMGISRYIWLDVLLEKEECYAFLHYQIKNNTLYLSFYH